jgi:hypothetical protein
MLRLAGAVGFGILEILICLNPLFAVFWALIIKQNKKVKDVKIIFILNQIY